VGRIKRSRKEVLHLHDLHSALQIRHDHGDVAAKFPDQLAASAARRREGISVSDYGNSVEPALAFADGFENGDALGANGEAVGSVLDVAAAKDSPRSGTKRRANAKVGVRRMRVFPCLPRGRNQSFIFVHANVSRHAPKYSTQWPRQFAE